MSKSVLVVSGPIASGKTTISQHIAASFGWPWTSFGSYVRAEALRRGLSDSRPILQQIGDDLIAQGQEDFCRAVLVAAGWSPGASVVLDGVRHVSVVNALRALVAPQSLILVYVTIAENTRVARLRARGVDLEVQHHYDAHANEADVLTTLPYIADIILDGSLDPDVLVASLANVIQGTP